MVVLEKDTQTANVPLIIKTPSSLHHEIYQYLAVHVTTLSQHDRILLFKQRTYKILTIKIILLLFMDFRF